MIRKVVFALLLTLQLAVVASTASAYAPFPGCWGSGCGDIR